MTPEDWNTLGGTRPSEDLLVRKGLGTHLKVPQGQIRPPRSGAPWEDFEARWSLCRDFSEGTRPSGNLLCTMPQKTIRELEDQHFEQALHFFMAADLLEDTSSAEEADGDHVDSDENVVQGDEIPMMLRVLGAEWLGIAEALRGNGTRGPYFQVPKSADFFELALQMPDRLFRYMFRMGRATFDTFVDILSQNPIFISRGRKPQRPVPYQLACFLFRYGQLGSPVEDPMLKINIGHGTVILYCRRVIKALRQLRDILDAGRRGDALDEDINLDTIPTEVTAPANIPHEETGGWLRDSGFALRDRMLDIVCPTHDYIN
ncbi:hypothetical protein GGX14DRAFT_385569 [Mycena pura]|uniref:Uncharacterized protein n=1 Tax=Mycena pura TaxID=153505 RepID=A0AAD7E3K2_9AGAR|nr:hypothetical protein GGX14DRAFT_385569 [Mycena pura]